jgi:hypothetical protein
MDVVAHLQHWCSTKAVAPSGFIALQDQYFILPSIHKMYNGTSDHLEDKFNVNKWRF